MKFTMHKLSAQSVDTLIAFAGQRQGPEQKKKAKDAKPDLDLRGLDRAIKERISQFVNDGSFNGSAGETLLLRDANVGQAKNILVVGLGKISELSVEKIRQAAAVGYRALVAAKIKSAVFHADSLAYTSSPEILGQAIGEGVTLASYSSDLFKSKGKEEPLEAIEFLFSSGPKRNAFEKGVKQGQIVGECANFSRSLGDKPGNLMTPTILAHETQKAATGTRLKVTVWGKDRIKKEKMGSFLSVSLGSSQEPKFIMLEYKGAPDNRKPMALVGKGLTFDCGGISIKPAAGMEDMKYDMCGGANIIGAMLAIARLKLKVNALAFIPSTENMPGPSANKPGDIVFARNGVSIEVNNTDAEGRLILADALVYACEQKPAFILDAATLTGAMVIALGSTHTGFFTHDKKLAQQIRKCAEVSGEEVWEMPLVDHHLQDMKGTFADLSNISSAKGAGSATAAAFLSQFIEDGIPWAHFDIAGTAWHTGNRLPYCPKKGASGVMVRTFVEMAKAHQSTR